MRKRRRLDSGVLRGLLAGFCVAFFGAGAAAQTISVSVRAVPGVVVEGSSGSFEFTLSASSPGGALAFYRIRAGTGSASAGDYSGALSSSGFVEFPANQARASVSYTALNDNVADSGETLVVELLRAPGGVAPGTPSSASATLNDHPRSITLSGPRRVTEGGTARYTATLLGWTAPPGGLRLQYRIEGASGEADFSSALQGNLSLAAGTVLGTFSVAAAVDDVAEGLEGFGVVISAAATTPPLDIATGQRFTAQIADLFELQLRGPPAAVAEGETARFTIRLAGGALQQQIFVFFQTNLLAGVTSGDLQRPPGTSLQAGEVVALPAGQREVMLDYRILDDALTEDAERFSVQLLRISSAPSLPGALQIASALPAEAVISASDGVLALLGGGAPSPVAEESGAEIVFALQLSGEALAGPVSLHFRTGGSATAGTDYRIGGSGVTFDASTETGTLVLAAGARSGGISAQVLDDSEAEPRELIALQLSGAEAAPGSPAIRADLSQRVAEILASDTTRASISARSTSIAEGSDAVFDIALNGATPAMPVTLDYTVAGSATSASDYTAVTGMLQIAAGADRGVLRIATVDDAVAEGAETIVVTLSALRSSAPAGALSVSTTSATVTIVGSDRVHATVRALSPTIPEARIATNIPQSARFEVCLAGEATPNAVFVSWQASGSAIEYANRPSSGIIHVDYRHDHFASGVFVDADGSSYTFIRSPGCMVIDHIIIDDTLNEGPDTIVLTLSRIGDGIASRPHSFSSTPAQTTIVDDDEIVLSLSPAAALVAEGGEAVFSVAYGGVRASAAVVLDYEIGGDVASGDYTDSNSGQVTFAAAATDSQRQIRIAIANDSAAETTETLRISVTAASGSSGGAIDISGASSSVEIAANDGILHAEPRVQNAMVTEGAEVMDLASTARFRICLAGEALETGRTAAVRYRLSGSARNRDQYSADGDYLQHFGSNITRTTTPGEYVQSFSSVGCGPWLDHHIVDDSRNEGAETIVFALRQISGGNIGAVLSYDSAPVQASIAPSDSSVVALSGPAAAVAEGSDAVWTIAVTGGAPTADITLPYTISGVAASDVDGGLRGEWRITPAAAAAARRTDNPVPVTFAIRVLADGLAEDAETLNLALDDSTERGPGGGGGGGLGIMGGQSAASLQIPANGGVRAVVSAAVAEVQEGGVAVFQVSLAGEARSQNLLLDYALSGAAEAGSDYTAPPQRQIVLPAARNNGEIRIQITDDAQTEPAESIVLQLTRLVGAAADGPFAVDPAPASVRIAGGDGIRALLRVVHGDVTEPGDPHPVSGVTEAAVFEFCLQGAAPTAPVVVFYSGASGAAVMQLAGIMNADYALQSGLPGAVSIPALGCISQTFDVIADDLNEPAEEIRLQISRASGGGGERLSFSAVPAVATIRATDAVLISVRGPANAVSEGGTAVFVLEIAGGIPSADFSAPISLGGVSASDLSSGVLLGVRDVTPMQAAAARRASNPEPITVSIGIADDALLESAEILTLTLDDTEQRRPSGGGGGGVQIAPGGGQAQATILGNDGIRADVAALQPRVVEGGEAQFVISLAGESHSAALFVDYSVGGTARAGIDHTGVASGTLRIAVGAQSGVLRFAVTDDDRTESAESIVVTLSALRGGGGSAALAFSQTPARADIAGSDGIFASMVLERSEVSESDEIGYNESSRLGLRICLEGEQPVSPVEVLYNFGGTARLLVPGITLDPTQPRPPGSTLPFADLYLLSGEAPVVTLQGLGCSAAIVFSVFGDSMNEGAERYSFELRGSAGGGILRHDWSLEGASVTIRASDAIRATLSAPAAAVSEGGSAVFGITLQGGTPTGNVVIPYSIGGTGIGGGDTSDSGGGRLIVTPAQAAAAATNPLAITIGILDDGVIEPQETLVLTLETPSSSGAVTVSPMQLQAVIADTDSATATLTGGMTVAEGGGAADAWTLRLVNGAEQRSSAAPLRILYTLSGTAQHGMDYILEAGSGLSLAQATPADGATPLPVIALPAGSSGGVLRIAPAADSNNEPTESVTLQLGRVLDSSGMDFARVGAGAAASSSIADDDSIAIALSGGGSVREGGVASFRVVLSGGAHSGEVVVPWSIGGTADTGDDDAEAADTSAISSAPLRIARGISSGEILVRIVADGVMEGEEAFALTLGTPTGGGGGVLQVTGSPRSATIAASGNTDRSVEISGPATAAEGARTTYSISISGDAPTADVLVRWSVAGSGASPAAAADFSGGAFPSGGPLTFTPGNYATAQSFAVETQADALLEGEERFSITLAVATSSAGVSSGDGASLSIAIGDDDAARVQLVRSDADGFGEAGAAGSAARTAVFSASVSGVQLTAPAELDFSVAGCGGGADCTYAPASPLRIMPGSGSLATGQITVTAADDALNEAAETIRVTITGARSAGRLELGSASAEASLADDDAIIVTIANAGGDDDPALPGVQVNEGGRAVFRVTLAGAAAGSAGAVAVPYTLSGVDLDSDIRDLTASRSGITADGGTLLIPAATASGLIVLEVVRDVLMEDAEILRVTLGAAPTSGPGGGAVARSGVASQQSAAVSIPANPAAARSFSVARDGTAPFGPVAEGGTVAFRITLSGAAPGSDASVRWRVAGSVSDSDWESSSAQTVVFTPDNWQSPRLIRIAIADDALNEGPEVLRVVLSGAAGGGAGGMGIAIASAEAELLASDPLRYEISADQRMDEGDSGATEVVFRVTLLGASLGSAGGAVRVPFSVAGESTALASEDYILDTAPLVFSGSSSLEIRVFILGDGRREDDETVILEMGAATSGSAAGVIVHGRRRATLTIANDDLPPAGLILSIARGDTDGFAEGGAAGAGTALFRVRVSGGALMRPVSALFSVSGTVDAGDYEIVSPTGAAASGGAFTITPPATSADIVIRARGDSLSEAEETLRVTIAAPTGGSSQPMALGAASASATLAASDGTNLRLARRSGESGGIAEGESAALVVELDIASAGSMSVAWEAQMVAQTNTAPSGPRARNGANAPEFRGVDGALRADGLGVFGVLQIPAGARSGVFHIAPARDQLEEDAEIIRITLGAVQVAGGGGAATVVRAPLEVTVRASAAPVALDMSDAEQRRRTQRVTTAVAALSRGAVTLANGAIQGRMARHREPRHTMPPWLRIAGYAWPQPQPQSQQLQPEAARARKAGAAPAPLGLALYGAAGSGVVNLGNLSSAAQRGPPALGGSASHAGAFRGLSAGLAGDANMGRRFAGPGRAGWLRGSSLELRSAAGAEPGSGGLLGSLHLWASGDLAQSRFNPGAGSTAPGWKLESAASHIGVETRLRGGALLAGAALGTSDGSLTFTQRAGTDEVSGSADSFVLSVHPYMGWQLAPGLHAWLTLGYGWGDVRMSERSGPAGSTPAEVRARSDSSLWTTAGGVSGSLRVSRRLEVAVALSTMHTHSSIDGGVFSGGAALPGVSASTTRVAGEVELAMDFALGEFSLRPFFGLRARRGSGDAGVSADASPGGTHSAGDSSGGVVVNWPAQGLVVDLRGRVQLVEGGFGRHSESGFTSSLSWDPGLNRRGLQLALKTGGVQRGLAGEVSYGIALRPVFAAGGVLLTPYHRVSFGASERRLAAGVRLQRPPEALQIGIEGGRLQRPGESSTSDWLLRADLRF